MTVAEACIAALFLKGSDQRDSTPYTKQQPVGRGTGCELPYNPQLTLGSKNFKIAAAAAANHAELLYKCICLPTVCRRKVLRYTTTRALYWHKYMIDILRQAAFLRQFRRKFDVSVFCPHTTAIFHWTLKRCYSHHPTPEQKRCGSCFWGEECFGFYLWWGHTSGRKLLLDKKILLPSFNCNPSKYRHNLTLCNPTPSFDQYHPQGWRTCLRAEGSTLWLKIRKL